MEYWRVLFGYGESLLSTSLTCSHRYEPFKVSQCELSRGSITAIKGSTAGRSAQFRIHSESVKRGSHCTCAGAHQVGSKPSKLLACFVLGNTQDGSISLRLIPCHGPSYLSTFGLYQSSPRNSKLSATRAKNSW